MLNESDKRQYHRTPTTYIVRYRLRCGLSNYDVVRTQNVSQGGALLMTSRQFKQGDELEMHIQFPFAGEKVEVSGRVIASNEKIKNSIYETRVEFIELSDAVKKTLGEVIERRKKLGH
ncbi:MAG: PilZ domain-containing protein [Candidatus Omnitrophica bacterium]|nr:PilZ domain-containing protein [Candidatus Omnitrophota bacterium]